VSGLPLPLPLPPAVRMEIWRKMAHGGLTPAFPANEHDALLADVRASFDWAATA